MSMADVPQDTLVCRQQSASDRFLRLAGVMFTFMMMNRQGGEPNAKAMSFGKSRAKLQHRQRQESDI